MNGATTGNSNTGREGQQHDGERNGYTRNSGSGGYESLEDLQQLTLEAETLEERLRPLRAFIALLTQLPAGDTRRLLILFRQNTPIEGELSLAEEAERAMSAFEAEQRGR